MTTERKYLSEHLRSEIGNYFIPLVRKNKCEICGATENLEVHHIYQFVDMLNDVLNELNLEFKYVDEYTELELLNIEEKMLGKHLYYNYKTLCRNCHLKESLNIYRTHRGYRIKKPIYFSFESNGETIIDEIENFIIPTELLNKWIRKEDIEEYLKGCNCRDRKNRILTVNKFLNIIENNSVYQSESKCIRIEGKRITHYKISKLKKENE